MDQRTSALVPGGIFQGVGEVLRDVREDRKALSLQMIKTFTVSERRT